MVVVGAEGFVVVVVVVVEGRVVVVAEGRVVVVVLDDGRVLVVVEGRVVVVGVVVGAAGRVVVVGIPSMDWLSCACRVARPFELHPTVVSATANTSAFAQNKVSGLVTP